jgi:hypothetical protein
VRSRLAALQPKPEVGWFYGSLQEAWLEASTHSSVRREKAPKTVQCRNTLGAWELEKSIRTAPPWGCPKLKCRITAHPTALSQGRQFQRRKLPGCAANDDKQGPGDGKVNNRDRLPHRAATHSVPLQLAPPCFLGPKPPTTTADPISIDSAVEASATSCSGGEGAATTRLVSCPGQQHPGSSQVRIGAATFFPRHWWVAIASTLEIMQTAPWILII